MKTYASLGVGDGCALDSILTQEERNKVSSLYFACRFGPVLAKLYLNNPFYPNLKECFFIPEDKGMEAMRSLDPIAIPFFHFRTDWGHNRKVGLQLLGLNEDEEINYWDMAKEFSSNRTFTNSSFLDNANESEINWNELGVLPYHYLLFHYPTSTRPRGDIASINDDDWLYVEKKSKEYGFKVLVVTDTDILPPLSNYILLKNYNIRSLVALVKYQYEFFGCDSFMGILSSKILPVDKLHLKCHKHDIQTEILGNFYQQKYFLPKTGKEISQFYKNYIG